MKTERIENRTVKDIYEELLGSENARIFLGKIQAEYEKGVSGEALREFAQHALSEFTTLKPDSIRLAVGVVAIVVLP